MLRARISIGTKNSEISEKTAIELSKLGFKVLSVADRGVNIEGSESLFAEVFASPLEKAKGSWRFEQSPKMPASINSDCSIYFPTPPEFF